MRKGELINKGIAAASTLAFMAAVRPDNGASLVGVALISVALYEALTYCIGYVRQIQKKKNDNRYITLTKRDMRRWADEWITPAIREVR